MGMGKEQANIGEEQVGMHEERVGIDKVCRSSWG